MLSFDKPILFLVFNRPDHTSKVFTRIREVKPKYLFVAADGPRSTHPEDAKKCEMVRKTILEGIDWNCELKTLFRNENLGCGLGVSSAINWFFDQVEDGIILEDDCLPDISFFDFCGKLLEYYKDDTRVMHISGDNFQRQNAHEHPSYYFSSFPHIWGWATWRRSWKTYDYTLAGYNESKITDCMRQYGFTRKEINHWSQILVKQSQESRVDTWDYQWLHAVWKNNGLSILPSVNLVKNIGFDDEATHTKKASNDLLGILTQGMDVLTHPKKMIVNRRADLYTFNTHFTDEDTISRRIKNKLWAVKNVLGRFTGVLSNT